MLMGPCHAPCHASESSFPAPRYPTPQSIVPVVMAGVLGIYGLIIAVIISTNSEYS
jgi:hypothetical protein